MAVIEYDDGSGFVEIDYDRFWYENGNGRNTLAPKAKIWTDKDVSISAGDTVRISKDGSRRFEGRAKNDGQYNPRGRKIYQIRGNGYEILEERISLSLSSTSPESVIDNVLPSGYTRSTSTSTGITIDSYDVTAKRKKILRDMMSRTNYVIRFAPDGTVYFNPLRDRGTLNSFDAQSNNINIMKWVENDIDTVINDVEVIGTSDGRKVIGSASDSTSISDYGTRSRSYNFRYIDSSSEADSMASERLQPSAKDNGKIRAAKDRFYSDNIVNYDIDLVDVSRGISSTVVVEKQKVYEEYVNLKVGEGVDFSMDEYNRGEISEEDKSEAGSTNGADTDQNLRDSTGSVVGDELTTTNHFNAVRNGTNTTGSASLNTTYTNGTGQDILVIATIELDTQPGEIAVVGFELDTGAGFTETSLTRLFNGSGNGDAIVKRDTFVGLVPNGADYQYNEGSGSGFASVYNETVVELNTT